MLSLLLKRSATNVSRNHHVAEPMKTDIIPKITDAVEDSAETKENWAKSPKNKKIMRGFVIVRPNALM